MEPEKRVLTIYLLVKALDRNYSADIFYSLEDTQHWMKRDFQRNLDYEKYTKKDEDFYSINQTEAWINGKLMHYDWFIIPHKVNLDLLGDIYESNSNH